MTYAQTKLAFKSYLIEFHKGNILTDAFCFSVPPESESLVFSNRISQTPTFGGICIDNYGKDVAKISLSGSTINQEMKFIFRSTLTSQYLSGDEEVFYLKKLLEDYENETTRSNCKLMLYDLSKASTVNSVGLLADGLLTNCYQVYPGELKISRNKSKPLAFDYSIDFTAVNPSKSTDVMPKVLTMLDKITRAIDGINQCMTLFTTFSDLVTSMDEAITSYLLKFTAFETHYMTFTNMFTSEGYSDWERWEEIITLGEDKISSSTKVDTSSVSNDKLTEEATGLVESAKEITDAWTASRDSIVGSSGDESGGQTTESSTASEFESRFSDDMEFIAAKIEKILSDFMDQNYTLKKSTLKMNVNVSTVINKDGSESAVIYYGHKKIVYKDGMTLAKIAQDEYNNPDFGSLIGKVNGIGSEYEIEPGTELKIPKLENTPSNINNLVYSANDDAILGSDLMLDSDGDIDVFNGDLNTVSGTNNLQQAIMTRLTSFTDVRTHNIFLGINKAVGETEGRHYLLSSIQQALLEEPRIDKILKISYRGEKDRIYVEIDYTDITGTERTFSGNI